MDTTWKYSYTLKIAIAVPVVLMMLFFQSISSAMAGDAALTWDPSTQTGLSGYKVYYGTASHSYSTSIDAGNQTSYTVTGLGTGTYYFAVTAYDTAGLESSYSNEASKTFADTTPPVISAIAAGSISSSGAGIAWTTNEPSDTQVQYGTTTAYGSSTALNGALVTSHAQSLTGLQASTLYHYRVLSRDAAGNLATSGDNSFTTSAAPDTTPPVISGITTSNITNGAATITWMTNEAASSEVEYGTTAAYGLSTTVNSTLVTSHSFGLTGLAASTTYHFRVKSADAAGNLATSGDNTFSTSAAPDTTPPVISGISAGNITNITTTITWITNEAASSQVEYGTTAAYGSSTAINSTLVTSQSVGLTSLTASTTYHFRVKSADAAGNLAASGDNTFITSAALDTTPPVLSLINAGNITSNGATISWGTNEQATTQADYGLTTAYGNSTTLNATLLNSHNQTLTGLTALTVYHYRVKSADAAGNLAASGDNTFTTSAAPDTTPPANVHNFKAQAGARQITLQWVNPSDSDFIGVRIVYRTDRYPSETNDGTLDGTLLGDFAGMPNQPMNTIQTSLQSGVTYYYSASSYDSSGNYQHTAYASATVMSSSSSDSGNPGNTIASGGCGMIRPGNGRPSGPAQAADMVGFLAVILIAIIKREIRRNKIFDKLPVSDIMYAFAGHRVEYNCTEDSFFLTDHRTAINEKA
ncbi:MAG TPA: fibronectin type III domain-containing protein [Nitrospiria bacterium]|nr:fibronectin type III domain-containing protein [Nitrospiria bacterium]